jgi:hypothetical protein
MMQKAKSTTGLDVCASSYTGKERDTELGNDYRSTEQNKQTPQQLQHEASFERRQIKLSEQIVCVIPQLQVSIVANKRK